MKKIFLVLSMAAVLWAGPAPAWSQSDAAAEVIALERKVMDAWIQGNPDPLFAVADPGITYFHVMTDKRVDGLAALKALVEPYRGRPLFDSYEMVEPKVQVAGEVAVLTYILVQKNGGAASRWNGTQGYQKRPGGWRLTHSHWSRTLGATS
jgi:hypothetical protein